MPKRTERDEHSDVFEGNPYADYEPHAMYSDLQWGNNPKAEWDLDAPEPMAAIGELAGLDLDGEIELHDDTPDAPFVAVGRDSNLLWFIPKHENGGPVNVPNFNPRSQHWRRIGKVRQTDYYSSKGGDAAYYYHNHQGPLPTMWEHGPSGCRVLIPAQHRGKRSYAVGKAGIVG